MTRPAIRGFGEAASLDVIHLVHEARDFRQARAHGRRQPLRPRQELVTAAVSPDEKRLEDSVGLNGVDEALEALDPSRRGALDLTHGYEAELRHAPGGHELVHVVLVVAHPVARGQALSLKRDLLRRKGRVLVVLFAS